MTARKRKLLVVDDDPGIRASLSLLLQNWGFEVLQACDAAEATSIVERQDPDIVITDVVMPEISGLELLRTLKAGDPHRPVLLITAQGSIDMAVEAMKQGARDFLTKPLTDHIRLKSLLDDAERELELRRKAKRLNVRIETEGGLGDFVGASKSMRDVFELIESVAGRDVSVMLTGESGTGKEMAALSIHRLSKRESKPFVAINAAAIPESLIESELFGHERGAFTGAVATRQGCFEQANSGTLFIDEIAEMPQSRRARAQAWRQSRIRVRCPCDCGHEPRSCESYRRRKASRRSLLPVERGSDCASHASRPAGRHSASGSTLHH
ncbi:MAG: hypothetical protein DMG11_08740 [Acidobacteria bacterium]|nr:MAG: hypothetical protein DMG11_08740 [Acidobacteriota bacterium]